MTIRHRVLDREDMRLLLGAVDMLGSSMCDHRNDEKIPKELRDSIPEHIARLAMLLVDLMSCEPIRFTFIENSAAFSSELHREVLDVIRKRSKS